MAFNFTVNGMTVPAGNPLQTKRRKFGIFSLIFIMLLGAIFTAAGVAIYKSSKIDPSWTRINGTVTGATPESGSNNGGTTYAPIISYSVNGQTYKITSSISGPSYPQNGSSRQIAYDPAAPAHAKVVESGAVKSFILLFPAIGVIMVVLAPILFIRSLRRSSDINNLTRTGQKIQGIITDIQINNASNQFNNGYSQTGNNSYRLIVSATNLAGTVQSYTSDWMSGIGGLAMADFRNNPIPIDVYVNQTNPQDYYVDVSEVPSLTPERIADLIQSVSHSMQPTSVQQPGSTPPIVSGVSAPPNVVTPITPATAAETPPQPPQAPTA